MAISKWLISADPLRKELHSIADFLASARTFFKAKWVLYELKWAFFAYFSNFFFWRVNRWLNWRNLMIGFVISDFLRTELLFSVGMFSDFIFTKYKLIKVILTIIYINQLTKIVNWNSQNIRHILTIIYIGLTHRIFSYPVWLLN